MSALIWLLLLVFVELPGARCDPQGPIDELIGACLSHEGCSRELADATSDSTNSTKSTNSSGSAGYEIYLEVKSDLAGIALVQALARELEIAHGRIRLASRAPRPGTRYTFNIAVPPDRDPESLAEIIQTSPTFVVTSIDVVALSGTVTMTTTMLYVDLPNAAWGTTELEHPAMQVNVIEDIVISAFVNIRGFITYDTTISYEPFSWWNWPIFMKVALIAWANDLIWTPPPVKANFSLHFFVVDQCKDPVLRLQSPVCKIPYNMEMVTNLYLGNAATGLPRSRAVIGGNLFTEKLAYLAARHNTPTLGFIQGNPGLSDKTEYPTFVRLNAPETTFFRIVGEVMSLFGFTIFDTWWCDVAGVSEMIGRTFEEYTSQGFKTVNFMLAPFQYSACPPGSETENALIKNRGWNMDEFIAKKNNLDINIQAALHFNAHAHSNAIFGECALFDIFHYFEQRGLIGAGHLWTSAKFSTMYTGSYIFTMVIIIPMFTGGRESTFKYGKPYDGAVLVESSDAGRSRPQYQELKTLMTFIGQWQQDYLDPWIRDRLPSKGFENLDSGLWYIQGGVSLLDATAATLYATNECVLKYGLSFTDEQLHREIKNLDFEGVGSRVRFNANGDPIKIFTIENCWYPPDFKVQTVEPQHATHLIGTYVTQLNLTETPVLYDGGTEMPSNEDRLCPKGERYERMTGKCLMCPIGTYTSRVGMAFCEPCSMGTFADMNGSKVCKPCGEGTFANSMGSTSCYTCGAGMYADSVQMSECKKCWVGSFSDSGARMCDLCPRGTYSVEEGRSQCTACVVGKTTLSVESISPDACVCATGSYLDFTGLDPTNNCVQCPAGMLCAEGSSIQPGAGLSPAALPGYMSLQWEPLITYVCMPLEACPGGAPGTCSNGRDGEVVACAACPKGTFDNGRGCRKCNGLAPLGLAFAVCLAIAVMTILATVLSNRDLMLQTQTGVVLTNIVGLLLSALQCLSAFKKLGINWQDPLFSLFEVLEIFNFDMKLLRTGCIMPPNPLLEYCTSQLLLFAIGILVLVTLVVKQRFAQTDIAPEFVNTVCSIFNTFFIGILILCVSPVVCYDQPGQRSSMRTSPSVLCFEGGMHVSMLVVGFATFLLLPLPYIAICSYGTFRFRTVVRGTGTSKYLKALRFLYVRFTKDRYYYGLVLLLRNFFICMIPVCLRETTAQIMCMAIVLLIFECIQNRLHPWRGREANVLDTAIQITLIVLLIAAALVAAGTITTFKTIGALCVAALATCLAVSLGAGVYRKLLERRTSYSAFICHHKADGAAQSRLLKMALVSAGLKNVYIDSDNLKNLNELFDVVKSQVQRLVVYLTRDTLRRAWCAGEIATAYRVPKLLTLAVYTPSFVKPTENSMQNLGSYVDESGCSLAQYGIMWDGVSEAFRNLLDDKTKSIRITQTIRFAKEFDFLATAILKPGSMPESSGDFQPLPDKAGRVIISAERGNVEAVAAAGILSHKLVNKLFHIEDADLLCLVHEKDTADKNVLCSLVASARSVVVLLSQGSMQSIDQVLVMIEAMSSSMRPGNTKPGERPSGGRLSCEQTNKLSIKHITSQRARPQKVGSSDSLSVAKKGDKPRGANHITPMSLLGFNFPDKHHIESILMHMCGDLHAEVRDHMTNFLKLIATPLSTHASDATLENLALDVARSVPTQSLASWRLLSPADEAIPWDHLALKREGLDAKITDAFEAALADQELDIKITEGFEAALADQEFDIKITEGFEVALADQELDIKITDGFEAALADQEFYIKITDGFEAAVADQDVAAL